MQKKSGQSAKIDQVDRRILVELQADGRISNAELAHRIGLPATSTSDRLRRLVRQGYIAGFGARLDPHALGLGLLAFVEVHLDKTTPDIFERFAEAVKRAIEQIDKARSEPGKRPGLSGLNVARA